MGQEVRDVSELVGAYPTCGKCNSRNVVRDAWADWNFALGEWGLKSVFDHFVCDGCGADITPIWKLDKEFRKKRIRRLNDMVRRGEGENATVVITAGIKARGNEFILEVRKAVAEYSDFSVDCDPFREHDFGVFKVQGQKLFLKIDYFDLALKIHSPDKANPKITHRVLTVMLAREY